MSKTRKVLMLVENLSVPADPRIWREARALRDHGLRVSVISPKGEKRDLESYVYIDGIHIYRYSLSSEAGRSLDYIKEYLVAMVMTFWLSLKVWSRHGFDVIHAANPPDTFFVIGLFYRLFGKKYIFDQHDLAPEMFHIKFRDRMKPLHKLLQFFERCSYQTAQVVITTNESQRRCAIERGHCSADKVFVVRNGPDINRFKSVPPELELKQGKRHLLAYIGVMSVQDGVEYVLYALDELIHKRGWQDVGLVLMGDGDQLPTLKALARQLKLDDYVNFTGWLPVHDLLRYLTVADIGLSPDPSNELNDHSTMLKTMEYMAMGKAVVAFDLPETRYSAQESALYATPNHIEEFADKIEILLKDDTLRNKLGALGRKRVEEVLSWDRNKVKLWQAYEYLYPDYKRSEQPADAPPSWAGS